MAIKRTLSNVADIPTYFSNSSWDTLKIVADNIEDLLKLSNDITNLDFDITSTYEVNEGEVTWNSEDGTLDIGLSGGVVLQIGQEMIIHAKANEALTNGNIVYASGAVGASGKIEVSKFIADNSIDEIYVLGVATQDIAIGEFGYITVFGNVRGIPTDGTAESETWINGTVLYASPTAAGQFTNVLPEAPDLAISAAMVVVSHANNGTLFVRPSRGYHISELHDVHIDAPETDEVLSYNSDRWINKTLAEAGISAVGHAHAHNALSDIGSNTHDQIDTHIDLTVEHLDWSADQGATNIHAGNYTDTGDTTDHTALSNIGTNTHAEIDTHLALTAEHIDWTVDQGATNIHSGNYDAGGFTGGDHIDLQAEQNATTADIDWTSIPAGTKRIQILFSQVSTDGTDDIILRLGDSGGIDIGNYNGGCEGASVTSAITVCTANAASDIWSGIITLCLEDATNNTWILSGQLHNGTLIQGSAGRKQLSTALDRMRLTTVAHLDVFDGGQINITYE